LNLRQCYSKEVAKAIGNAPNPSPRGSDIEMRRDAMTKISAAVVAVSAAVCLALAVPAFADDAHHPEKVPAETAKPTVQPAAKAAAKPADETVKAMQGNVGKMKQQLRRIAATKDEAARGKLIAEHMQTMHENMQMAKAMMHEHGDGCPMMGEMMSGKGGMMMHGQGGMGGQSGGMDERMRQMEQRMEMMEKRLPPADKP
jgi:hypothetical protein